MYPIGALAVTSISLIASKLFVTLSKAFYGSGLLSDLLGFNITLRLNDKRDRTHFEAVFCAVLDLTFTRLKAIVDQAGPGTIPDLDHQMVS